MNTREGLINRNIKTNRGLISDMRSCKVSAGLVDYDQFSEKLISASSIIVDRQEEMFIALLMDAIPFNEVVFTRISDSGFPVFKIFINELYIDVIYTDKEKERNIRCFNNDHNIQKVIKDYLID